MYQDIYEIDPVNLTTFEVLGQGAFGRVLKGKLVQHGLGQEEEEAVKKDNSSGSSTVSPTAPLKNDQQRLQSKTSIVAVKTLKEGSNADDVAVFLSEIALMKTIGPHPNILHIIGCVTVGQTIPCIVTEFCPYGDLRNFLRQHRESGGVEALKKQYQQMRIKYYQRQQQQQLRQQQQQQQISHHHQQSNDSALPDDFMPISPGRANILD